MTILWPPFVGWMVFCSLLFRILSRTRVDRLRLITYGIRDGRSINFDEFKNLLFLFPSKEEQHAIATFFRSLDRQIALHTQRLEKLKQIKAACLDKMFV